MFVGIILFYSPSIYLAQRWWVPFLIHTIYLASTTHLTSTFPCGPTWPADTPPKWLPFCHTQEVALARTGMPRWDSQYALPHLWATLVWTITPQNESRPEKGEPATHTSTTTHTSIITNHSWSSQLGAIPVHQQPCSSYSPTIRRCIQITQGAPLKCLVLVTPGGLLFWAPEDAYYVKPLL